MSSLYLIDGNNLVHRGYHATKKANMTNGIIPTGAIYSFQRAVKATIRDLGIYNMAIFFDHSGRLERHDIYSGYKANRSHNEEVSVQYPYVRTWCWLYGIFTMSQEGFEADDLIFSAHKILYPDFDEIYIVSNDKDLCQLVDEKTYILDLINGYKKLVVKDVIEKFGVEPDAIPMFLALAGDSSDNIPGCKDIGKIGAKRIINEYGKTFNEVFGNISKIEQKTAEKLMNSIENIRMSYELAMLRCVKDTEYITKDMMKIGDKNEIALDDFYFHLKIKT